MLALRLSNTLLYFFWRDLCTVEPIKHTIKQHTDLFVCTIQRFASRWKGLSYAFMGKVLPEQQSSIGAIRRLATRKNIKYRLSTLHIPYPAPNNMFVLHTLQRGSTATATVFQNRQTKRWVMREYFWQPP